MDYLLFFGVMFALSMIARICVGSEMGNHTNGVIIVDYFYEPGCAECDKIEADILPQLEERYRGQYTLQRHDVGVESNAVVLFELEAQLKITNETMNCIFVEKKHCFDGYVNMTNGLLSAVMEAVGNRRKNISEVR